MLSFTFESLIEECGSIQKAERLAYIDFKLFYLGTISRSDINEFFGIADAASSKEITAYKRLRPHNVEYNRTLRVNSILRETFEPLIVVSPDVALGMLANGFNKNKLDEKKLINYQRVGGSYFNYCSDGVSKLTRAIHGKYAVECEYVSANSSNHNMRTLFPSAIFYDGNTWGFRAYDRNVNNNKSGFKCFNFSRLNTVLERTELAPKASESYEKDKEWNQMVPVHLSLHTKLNENKKFALIKDFGLSSEQNSFIITERAALLYFLFDIWKIDCGNTESKEGNYNFILENSNLLKEFSSISSLLTK
jgi:hypothetical protein